MRGGFNKREHTNIKIIRLHPPMVEIFRNNKWLGFFELLKGFDDELDQECLVSLHSEADYKATIMVRGLVITITPDIISAVTTLPLGFRWNREENFSRTASNNILLFPN